LFIKVTDDAAISKSFYTIYIKIRHMKTKILALMAALAMMAVLAGCGGTDVEDCGNLQLKDLSSLFGPNPPPMDFSQDTELICFERHLKECSPAVLSTISHDGGTTGRFEIKGEANAKCMIDAFSQSGGRTPIQAECPYDLSELQNTVNKYAVYQQEGGMAFAFILKSAFTLVKPPAECIVKS
jgi:hypothetical protein